MCLACIDNLLSCDEGELRKIIEHSMPRIVNHLDYAALWPYLVKYSVFSDNEMEKLQQGCVTRYDRAQTMYYALRNNSNFQKFVKALSEEASSDNSSQGHRQILRDLMLANTNKITSPVRQPVLWTSHDLNLLDPHNFKVLGLCGKGTFSAVYNALYYGIRCVAKVTTERDVTVCKISWHEANILSSCSHPRIVQCFEVKSSVEHLSAVLILELMLGNLVEFIEQHKDIMAVELQQILFACDVSSALCYLHEKEIFHGNITSHNVLVAVKHHNQYLAKLCDFGLAKTSQCSPHPLHNQSHSMFMAPEHHTPTSSPSDLADIFSTGVVMLHVVTQTLPFYDKISPILSTSGKRIAELILRQSHLQMIDRDAPHLELIIKQCLQDEPKDRPSAAKLCACFNNYSTYQHFLRYRTYVEWSCSIILYICTQAVLTNSTYYNIL